MHNLIIMSQHVFLVIPVIMLLLEIRVHNVIYYTPFHSTSSITKGYSEQTKGPRPSTLLSNIHM